MKFMIVFNISLLALFTSCSPSMKDIQQQVALDTVKSYEITKKGGDKIEICVKAGLVAETFNQAHDEKNYLAWKQTEKADCELAGIPK